MRVTVVHDRLPPGAPADQLDAKAQADVVADALARLGHACAATEVDPCLPAWSRRLAELGTECVFNLVESLDGKGRLIHLAPAWLEAEGFRFTGAGAAAQFLSSDKKTAKTLLRASGLATPPAWHPGDPLPPDEDAARGLWILKPRWEHGSVGLDGDAVRAFDGAESLARAVTACGARGHGEYFAERFVDGREINVGLLADGADGPEVLPPTEIVFDLPPGMPRVMGYAAKWQEASTEYRGTQPRFVDPGSVRDVLDAARRVWAVFGLAGYARVDFRLDADHSMWILDVNANPCLAPDAGFALMLARARIPFHEAVGRILADAEIGGCPAAT